MCGICGIISFNNNIVTEPVIHSMCKVISHRGPDDEGMFIGNNSHVGLGMRRLSIIDLQTGHQPVFNEDKSICLVLNGEIYNFQELKTRLINEGHKFYTKTDTEVVAHLYEKYGYDCVTHLRGMFAFALWDDNKKALFIARDRVGKKPLVYAVNNGQLSFGSEIKCLLEAGSSKREIDHNAIDMFLTYQYIPSPMTIFDDIKRLPPASYMVCDSKGNIKITKYWELDFSKKTNLTFTESCGEIKRILTESTKLRMISDVPLGAFLSGGHDSSIIAGIMSRLSDKPVKTFSIGFEEEGFSELPYARIVANHFGTEHNEFNVKPDMIEILPKLIWHYDQPFADTSIIPSYYVSNITRKYVKVALNGDGGDENFCGYLRYPAIKLSSMFPFEILGRKFYEKTGKMIPLVETTSVKNKLRYFRRFFTALGEPVPVRNVLWHCFFTNEIKRFIYSDYMNNMIKQNSYDYLVDVYNKPDYDDILDRVSYTDINTYLPEDLLVKMDIASMSNSLEARSPLLDHNLLEFTATLPSSWKLKNGINKKYILKETFRDFLPKEIMSRPKQGFGIPIGKWLREDLSGYLKEILYSEQTMRRPYFNHKNIKILVENHLSGKEDHGYRLFALIVLELWHRIFIDKNIKI